MRENTDRKTPKIRTLFKQRSVYRNQSIDLNYKSICWFLYDEKMRLKWVNMLNITANVNIFVSDELKQN